MLRPDELERQLQGKLAGVYLVAGDEPLFIRESLDAIRAAARKAGCDEREVLEVESGFDWGRLQEAAGNLSLFGERRLIELRMPTGKPGTVGAKAIASYCERPADDVVLVIVCGALDASQRKSAWVTACDKAGVFVYAWPLPLPQLPQWISQRLARHGFRAQPEAAALLAERAEGNLMAAAQEIEKLSLVHSGGGELTLEQMAAAVADSARFNGFDLADAALDGRVARCARIVQALKQEGEEPVPTLWPLARDVRVLSELAARRPPDEVFRRHKVWNRQRQPVYVQLARQAPGAWPALLARAARADRVLKGLEPGRAWDELLQLATAIARAGKRV